MKIECPLRRREAATLVQLRTDHFPLSKHLHRIGTAPSPLCDRCNEDQQESVFHFLMRCPANNVARRALRRKASEAADSISKLLTPGEHSTHLLQYIRDTRRFRVEPTTPAGNEEDEEPNEGADAARRAQRKETLQKGQAMWIRMGWAYQEGEGGTTGEDAEEHG
jgi:hypothetical protein